MDDTKLGPVPFLDLIAQHKPLQKEIDEAISRIFGNTSFVLGPDVEKFENAFAEYCGAKHCVSVSNGTVALHLALLGLGIGPDDEVITAANSFIATAEAISFAGATPVFVDALESTSNIDWSKVEAAVTPRTKALMPVHLYGQPARMDKLKEIAQRHSLKIIEDACQAHGSSFQGRRAGALGDAACFSFYPGKNLGAAGDGGAIVTNDASLAETLKLIRNHGSAKKYHHEILGHNFRLDSIQAAVLSIKLPHLDGWNAKRREHAIFYDSQLKELPGIEVHQIEADAVPAYHLYVIKVHDRKLVQKVLDENNVGHGIHYPIPIHKQPAYAKFNSQSFPVSEKLADNIISLPMFAELTREQQERVVSALAKASKEMTAVGGATR